MYKIIQHFLIVFLIWIPPTNRTLGGEPTESLPPCGQGSWNEGSAVEQRHLFWKKYQLRLGRHVLQLIDQNGSIVDQAPVKQQDYGVAQAVYRSAANTLIVIGEQTSYQIPLKRKGETLQFGDAEAMPTLFREPCSWTNQFFGACQNSIALYNLHLGAAFIDGYDRWGSFHSFAFGLGSNPVTEFEPSRGYRFVTGVTNSTDVLFQDKDGNYSLFDGASFKKCHLEQEFRKTP